MSKKVNCNFRQGTVLLVVIGLILFGIYNAILPSQNLVLQKDGNIEINVARISQNNLTSFSKNEQQLVQTKCKPAYLAIKYMWHITEAFNKHGFLRICSAEEEATLRTSKWSKKYGGYGCCYKYTHSNAYNFDSSFCNGGRLIYKGTKEERMLEKRLTSKANLNALLIQYCDKYHTDDNECNFHLRSYNMNIKKERIEFLTKHIDCSNDKRQYDKTWVFKEDKHLGQGVHFNDLHQLIYRLIVASQNEAIIIGCPFNPLTNESYFKQEGFSYRQIEDTNDTKERRYVVQRKGLLLQPFVSNPLLLFQPNAPMKHAFHIRSFFFIASYTEPFIVLSWPKYVLLVNPHEYQNKEKLNKASIITNRHVSQHEELVDDKYDWIWGSTELQQLIDRAYGKDVSDGNYATNKLRKDIKQMLSLILNANSYANEIGFMGKVGKHKNMIDENDFELTIDEYCLDILINDQLEVKLTEINTYCGIFCNQTKIIEKKKHGVYDWDCDGWRKETMQVTSEIFRKKSYNMTIENIDSLKDYEIVHWEK